MVCYLLRTSCGSVISLFRPRLDSCLYTTDLNNYKHSFIRVYSPISLGWESVSSLSLRKGLLEYSLLHGCSEVELEIGGSVPEYGTRDWTLRIGTDPLSIIKDWDTFITEDRLKRNGSQRINYLWNVLILNNLFFTLAPSKGRYSCTTK